jgi:hypothetical protein
MKNDYSELLSEKFGEPIGMSAGEPMIGVRDERGDICSSCGMMPIESSCGCDAEESVEACAGCGEAIDQCMCGEDEDVCSSCGMMPVDGSCGCGESCPRCNQMPVGGSCGCIMGEAAKACSQCGMKEMCECGMTEVAPPGHEKMVKGLKKAQKKGDVENAYAIAWHHYNVKHPGGKGKKHTS